MAKRGDSGWTCSASWSAPPLPDALYLRGYDELIHHNLILRAGRQPAAARLAFRVRTAADLDLAEAFFAALGSRTARVPAGVTPGVGEAVRAEDPLGFTVEFFFDAEYAERLQQRYDLRRGAEPARLDHFNIVVPDVRAAYEHYTSLGFGLSETIEDGADALRRLDVPQADRARRGVHRGRRGRACTTWGSSPTSRTRCCGSATSWARCTKNP